MQKKYPSARKNINNNLTPQAIAQSIVSKNSPYFLIDIRKIPDEQHVKYIKSAHSIPRSELRALLPQFDKQKIYIICDWCAGSLASRKAIVTLLDAGLDAHELPGGVDVWYQMNLPTDS
ncbi:rhodanese-like domain-containing protein [Periweissella beninensis]|nr:rhodanese-like domain-containing protein [Periweissella beninensis]